MKPDTDTEKYSGHNIGNNMFIKTFADPGNMKISLKMAGFHITLLHPPATLLHPRTINFRP
jgi:hypothetical protein